MCLGWLRLKMSFGDINDDGQFAIGFLANACEGMRRQFLEQDYLFADSRHPLCGHGLPFRRCFIYWMHTPSKIPDGINGGCILTRLTGGRFRGRPLANPCVWANGTEP